MLSAQFVRLTVLGRALFAIGACRTWDDSAATAPENGNQRGPYFTAFSLHIADMRSFFNVRRIVRICPRSRTVYFESVFRYRTPLSQIISLVT